MEDDPAYDIAIAHLDGRPIADDAPLRQAILTALRTHSIPTAHIGVALVDDDRMAELNERHLQHAGPTDVLTFDLSEPAADAADADPKAPAIEGEIVISLDTAAREADLRGHDTAAELALYAVHGTLHLLGYDDADESKAERMHEAEDKILEAAGLGPVYRRASR